MGLTISGSVYIGSSAFSLGNVLAYSKAEIYKKLFDGFVDVNALQKNFPSRVQITDSMVSLVGPVAIVKSPTMFKVGFIALAGIVAAGLVYCLASKGKSSPASPAATRKSPKKEKILHSLILQAWVLVLLLHILQVSMRKVASQLSLAFTSGKPGFRILFTNPAFVKMPDFS